MPWLSMKISLAHYQQFLSIHVGNLDGLLYQAPFAFWT